MNEELNYNEAAERLLYHFLVSKSALYYYMLNLKQLGKISEIQLEELSNFIKGYLYKHGTITSILDSTLVWSKTHEPSNLPSNKRSIFWSDLHIEFSRASRTLSTMFIPQ